MRTISLLLLFSVVVLAASAEPFVPNRRAHAHNDYEHSRPLADALDQGFCSVEADVYLVDGKLLVAHNRKDCRPERTLESLYLEPLQKRVRQNGGVFPGVVGFCLWLDVKVDSAKTKGDEAKNKEESENTCKRINELLEQYSGMLTQFSERQVKTNAVTVILTGSHSEMSPKGMQYVCYDSTSAKAVSEPPQKFSLALSENWTHLFTWRGDGKMPALEKDRLRDLIAEAHAHGKRVRFWATPEKVPVWNELLAADVDWIGTDHLKELAEFLNMQDKQPLATK
ncbi:MAG: hypothetical protein JWM68_1531 [Verrucomicrobiales bacterium]|nr:hypothetical protein [Verrucomicrobiales bacterium]